MPYVRSGAWAAERTSRTEWMSRKREAERRKRESDDDVITGADVIAMPGRCWCGEPVGHDWPGRVPGPGNAAWAGPGSTPHPR